MMPDFSLPCVGCGGTHVTEAHVQAGIARALSGQCVLSPRFCMCGDCGCDVRVEAIAGGIEVVIDACPDFGDVHTILREMAAALRRSGRMLTPDLLPSGAHFRTAGV